MSEELKPCPFHNSIICGCWNSVDIPVSHWNTRPIEDALKARIAELTIPDDVLETLLKVMRSLPLAWGHVIDSKDQQSLDWLKGQKERMRK